MKKKRKICFITGSRAEYGLLSKMMRLVQSDLDLAVQLVVTGSHLSTAFGETVRAIEEDGFDIVHRIPLSGQGGNPEDVAKAIGNATAEFAKCFSRLKPEWVVVLGDRYEIFAAVQAALILKVPVAHIAGGDVTEGAFDDALRHSITKMSHIHFVTHEQAASRVRQLGEDTQRIFNFGSPAIDSIAELDLMEKKEVEKLLDYKFRAKNLIVTFHPCTLDEQPAGRQVQALIEALHSLPEETGLIITKANADSEGRIVNTMLQQYVKRSKNACLRSSLGHKLYLNALRFVSAMVGNSSSGIYEAPSFCIPTVNIGDRQKGRMQAESVINCRAQRDDIEKAIQEAFKKNCSNVINPYGEGGASVKIYQKLKEINNPKLLIKKRFIDVASNDPAKHVFVVAEIGVNHNGSLDIAKELIRKMKAAGADAVKFQTFKADRLVSRQLEKADYQKTDLSDDQSQWSMLKKLELSEAAHVEIKKFCEKLGIEFLSSPFHEEDLDFLLKQIGIRKIKIPSGEITNAPLLLKAAQSGLPIMLSTGMSAMDEIEQALDILTFGTLYPKTTPSSIEQFDQAFKSFDGGRVLKEKVILLHCTSEYPAPPEDVNLKAMDSIRQKFGLPVGLSDHSLGSSASLAAVARGAVIIEKHVTLDKGMQGPDHRASITPTEAAELVRSIRMIEKTWGDGIKKPRTSEVKNVAAVRRYLVAKRFIRKGDIFTKENITSKRVGSGISPFCYWDMLGKRAVEEYQPDDRMK